MNSNQGRIIITNLDLFNLTEHDITFLDEVARSGFGKFFIHAEIYSVHLTGKISQNKDTSWSTTTGKRILLKKIDGKNYRAIRVYSDHEKYIQALKEQAEKLKSTNNYYGPGYHWHCYDQGLGGSNRAHNQALASS